MKPITTIAETMGLDQKTVLPYGHHKAKISLEAIRKDGPVGKLVLVTGMTPTRAGEGKTTTSVGLTQALGKLGYRSSATLREPSLGPIFGIKGGGTGGGASRVIPEDEINVHFTGDAHAVASAHNLLSALTDNAVQRGAIMGLNPSGIEWRRVVDVEERSLRTIVTGLGGSENGPVRETGFDIVTASEIMASLALSTDLDNLRERLGRIVVGFTDNDDPVTAEDVDAVGSMMALLRYAIQPNLVQTLEGQPVVVHTGPFGNIAHGCSSVISDKLSLGYSEYVITEAGFGADLGFEKFMHIKARFNNLEPAAVVLVSTVRAIKSHGGVPMKNLDIPNNSAVEKGMPNVEHMVRLIRSFGLPVIVAINRFPSDSPEEIESVKKRSEQAGADTAVESQVFDSGGAGGIELAEAVVAACRKAPHKISYLYEENVSIEEKVRTLATQVYGAERIIWATKARQQREHFEKLGWGKLPVCIAKTHLSLSDNPRLKARPSGYAFRVSDIRASIGAGFIYPVAGTIVTMPGLPSKPRTLDIDNEGNILGL